MTTLLILFTSGSVLLFLLALPLLAEKVPPNRLYGFRVEATLRDRRLWYAVNRFGAQRLIWAAAAEFGSALFLYWLADLSVDEYAWGCLAVFVLVGTIGGIQTFRFLHRSPRDLDGP